MSENRRFEFRRITKHLRPPRVAVLLRADLPYWRRAALSILEWTTRVWGGRYVPIVPTDGESIDDFYWTCLEAFDPDYIYVYEADGRDLEDHDEEQFEQVVDQVVEQNTEDADRSVSPEKRNRFREVVRSLGVGKPEMTDELRASIRERLNPFHRDTRVTHHLGGRAGSTSHHLTEVADIAGSQVNHSIARRDLSSITPELRLMAASVIGRISKPLREGLSEVDVRVEDRAVEPSDFPKLMKEAWEREDRDGQVPYVLTNLNCSRAYRSSVRRHEEPTVVVCGSTLHDYCRYQCLRSFKAHVYWLPDSLLPEPSSEGAAEGKQHTELLRWHLSNHVRSSPGSFWLDRENEVRLFSYSHDANKLEQVAQQIGKDEVALLSKGGKFLERLTVSERIDDLFQYRFEIFENGNVDRRSVMQFEDGTSVDKAETPKPKHWSEVSTWDHRWIADLEIQDYHLPPLTEFGPETVDIDRYDSDYVRVTRRGFSYFCPNHTHLGGQTVDQILAKPTLRLQPPLRVIDTIFGRAGYDIQPSDKGNFQRQASLRTGGFENLYELLRREAFRSLLDRYVEVDESSSRDEEVYLMGSRRCYLPFAGIEELAGDSDRAMRLIDEMVERGVLRRGLILQCQSCRNAAWYDVADLTQQFSCERCRQTQRIQSSHWKRPPEGPMWYFQLDEVVYQYYQHNTHVTTLALGALKERASSFLHVPEIELRDDSSSAKPETEIDICAVADGKLIIGEASVSAEKSRGDVDSYIHLASEVGAKSVVFATLSGEWSASLVDYGKNQGDSTSRTPEVEFMARADLVGGE